MPVLFTGSIRENLAPFGGHTDSALWSALRRAHLAPVVEDWEAEGLGGLDFVLGEGGSPLSAGQKQLLALARALLNPAKVRKGGGGGANALQRAVPSAVTVPSGGGAFLE